MDAESFAYWLRGFFEMNNDIEKLTKKQVRMIRQHLDLVFDEEPAPTTRVHIEYFNKNKAELMGSENRVLALDDNGDVVIEYNPGLTTTSC